MDQPYKRKPVTESERIRREDQMLRSALQRRPESFAALIHYPQHWDVAAYPSLESAVLEILGCAGCSECRASAHDKAA